jgi:glutaconate CoA-transferase, subunit A
LSDNSPMIDKYKSLQDAAALVNPGAVLALGGVTLYRRPVAFVRELLRRTDRPDGLTLLTFTAGYESDLLVGAGLIKTIRTCYFGLEIFGFAPMFTAAANAGAIGIMEESETSLAAGIRATMNGVPFLPSTAWQGTDLLTLRPDVQTIHDPYTNQALTAFPAIAADVAVIHALVADRSGNARLNNNWGIDRELPMIARTTIITAEEIVDHLTEDVTIAGAVVSAVVHAPRGAFPTSCHPLYPVGGGELLRYVDECAANRFPDYLAEFLR